MTPDPTPLATSKLSGDNPVLAGEGINTAAERVAPSESRVDVLHRMLPNFSRESVEYSLLAYDIATFVAERITAASMNLIERKIAGLDTGSFVDALRSVWPEGEGIHFHLPVASQYGGGAKTPITFLLYSSKGDQVAECVSNIFVPGPFTGMTFFYGRFAEAETAEAMQKQLFELQRACYHESIHIFSPGTTFEYEPGDTKADISRKTFEYLSNPGEVYAFAFETAWAFHRDSPDTPVSVELLQKLAPTLSVAIQNYLVAYGDPEKQERLSVHGDIKGLHEEFVATVAEFVGFLNAKGEVEGRGTIN